MPDINADIMIFFVACQREVYIAISRPKYAKYVRVFLDKPWLYGKQSTKTQQICAALAIREA